MPSFRSIIVALIGLCILSSWAYAAADWRPIHEGNLRTDVSTWVRPAEGLPVNEFRGITEVHHHILTVLALLADTGNLPQWVFQCKLAEHPEGNPPQQVYLRFRAMWPTSERDVLVNNRVSQDSDYTVLVDTTSISGYPAQAGVVRMPRLHNTFRLIPLKEGWTRVEFDTLLDPGGLIPAWLSNLIATKAPWVTLSKMHEQLDKPAYQIKSAQELPDYYRVGHPLVVPDYHLPPELQAK